jgi:hypothetical protein
MNCPRKPPRPAERLRLERRARERLEKLHGRPFSDEEWQEVRKTLRGFFLVLRDWEAR